MSNNGVIIGTFVKQNKILTFLEFLKNKLSLNLDKIFVFTIENNKTEYLVTFSSPRKSVHFHKLHDATILHTKNGCLFSINALNKYIEKNNPENLPRDKFEVNWDILKNTLLITTNGHLRISKLTKIKDKNIFFI